MSSKSPLPTVTLNDLWEAGVHYGHKASRWNPAMSPYIYGEKNGLHIIDIRQTVALMNAAMKKIYSTVKNNGKILFAGTRVQTADIISEYAKKCGQFYINNRWLGGTLTNLSTISKSIKKLDELENKIEANIESSVYTKKEILTLTRQKDKLISQLGGIREMNGLPDLIIIFDTNRNALAISEARKLNIPIIAILDTNSDTRYIDYPIPGNDDAIRAIILYCKMFAESALIAIEDALVESGVDIGEISEAHLKPKQNQKGRVVKINQKKKIYNKNSPVSDSASLEGESINFDEKISGSSDKVSAKVEKKG